VKPDFKFDTVTTNLLDGWTRQDRRNRRAVLFVHGFIGDPLTTWQAPKPSLAFPELMIEDPSLVDFDVFRFKYMASPFSGPDIQNIAQQLENAIRQEMAGYQVVLLAHSMGGLVCMQYILRLLQKGQRLPVIGLLMFGTPTTGVEWVNVARIVLEIGGLKLDLLKALKKLFANNSQYQQLAVASQFLQDLHGQWILRVVNGGYASVPASQRGWVPVRVVTGNEDWVVKEDSAKGFYGEIDWNPVQLDHRSLVKPIDRKAPSYKCAAEFLVSCRQTYQPEILGELRQASDWVWGLRTKKVIRNWKLDIRFEEADVASPRSAFEVDRFAKCEVSCRYSLVLTDQPFVLGLTLGLDAARSCWKEDSVVVPAYIHQIFLETMRTAERKAVAETLGSLLAHGEEAWAGLFENVRMRIAAAGTEAWHDLTAGDVEGDDGHLLKTFRLPDAARALIGEEVTLDLGFRSVRPPVLNDFTLQFPWLTLGFDALVVIEGATEHVFATSQLFGQARAAIEPEDYGKGKKIRISSERDLVLPGSNVRIKWLRMQKEDEMNGFGGGKAKKAAAKKPAKKATAKKKTAKKTAKNPAAKKTTAKKTTAKK
jgi:pimeloyl-ACP methyl ester carboxylesterase